MGLWFAKGGGVGFWFAKGGVGFWFAEGGGSWVLVC